MKCPICGSSVHEDRDVYKEPFEINGVCLNCGLVFQGKSYVIFQVGDIVEIILDDDVCDRGILPIDPKGTKAKVENSFYAVNGLYHGKLVHISPIYTSEDKKEPRKYFINPLYIRRIS